MKLYDQADRWVKNAARSVYKNMTYENALRAVMLASVGTNVAGAAGSVMSGLASGSASQVAGGLASGLAAASYAAPSVRPAAEAANVVANVSGAASAMSGGIRREQAARRAQGPMTAQGYLNRYNVPYANRNWGTAQQYQTSMSRRQ